MTFFVELGLDITKGTLAAVWYLVSEALVWAFTHQSWMALSWSRFTAWSVKEIGLCFHSTDSDALGGWLGWQMSGSTNLYY